MIPRCRLLSSIWMRTLPQLSRNSHATCVVERVYSLSSTVSRSYLDYDSISSNATVDKLALGKREPDYLWEAVDQSETLEDIFKLIENHAPIMGDNHLFNCILKIEALVSHGFPVESVRDHPAFRKWMESVCLRISDFSGKQQVRLLFALRELEVKANEDVMMSICDNLRFKLADLKFSRLVSLHFLLQQFEESPASLHVLSRTVSAVTAARIEAEQVENDTKMSFTALNFILSSGDHGPAFHLAAEAALKQCQNFDVSMAYEILVASTQKRVAPLCLDSMSNDKMSQILSVCASTVADNIDGFSDEELQRLLSARGPWCAGSYRFFEVLWNRASEWNLKEKGALVGLSIRAGYMTLPLADNIVTWFLEEPDEFCSDTRIAYNLAQLAAAIACSAVHNDRGSDAHERAVRAVNVLLDFVTTHEESLEVTSSHLSFFLVQICCCGVYPRHFLDRVFSVSLRGELPAIVPYLDNLSKLEELMAFDLEQSSDYTMKPEYRAKALSQRPRSAIPRILFDILTVELGGRDFVERKLKVSGCPVGMLFAMNSKGVPVEIPGRLQNSLNLKALPTNTKVVAVLYGRRTQFSSGLYKPVYARRIQWLQAQNISPVVIDSLELDRAPPETWRDILMSRVKEAVRRGAMYR